MADDKVVVLNDWPGLFKTLKRTRASGKERVTIEVKSEALGFLTDERVYAQAMAEAFAEGLKQAIRDFGEFATETTRRARKRYAESPDNPSTQKRYSGGRLKEMPPNQTQRSLIDSGRLLKGIAAMATKDRSTVVVNVPANRLDNPGVYANTMRKLAPLIAAAQVGKQVMETGAKLAKGLVSKAQFSFQDRRREVIGLIGRGLSNLSNLGRELEDLSDE